MTSNKVSLRASEPPGHPLRTPTLGAGAPVVVPQWSFPLQNFAMRIRAGFTPRAHCWGGHAWEPTPSPSAV